MKALRIEQSNNLSKQCDIGNRPYKLFKGLSSSNELLTKWKPPRNRGWWRTADESRRTDWGWGGDYCWISSSRSHHSGRYSDGQITESSLCPDVPPKHVFLKGLRDAYAKVICMSFHLRAFPLVCPGRLTFFIQTPFHQRHVGRLVWQAVMSQRLVSEGFPICCVCCRQIWDKIWEAFILSIMPNDSTDLSC